jgi:hypothetical protein
LVFFFNLRELSKVINAKDEALFPMKAIGNHYFGVGGYFGFLTFRQDYNFHFILLVIDEA